MARIGLTRPVRALVVIAFAFAVLFGVLGQVTTADAGVITNWRSLSPQGNAGANIPLTVQANTAYNPDPLVSASLNLYVDGVLIPRQSYVASVLSTSIYIYYVPQPALTDGLHTFRVEVSDTKARLSTKQWTANIVQAPTASWRAPAAGTVIEDGRPTIVMSLADNTPGTLFTVAGQVRSGSAAGPVVRTFGGSGTSVLPSFALASELPTGTYYLTATVTDAKGNATTLAGSSARGFTAAAFPAMTVLDDCETCHPTYRAAHPTSLDANCVGCHQGYDGQHSAPYPSCTWCHDEWHTGGAKTNVPVSGACTSCHNAGRADIPRHTASSVAPSHVGSCDGCHEGSLIARHETTPAGSAYPYQCGLCHSNSDTEVSAAVEGGDTSCRGCHGEQHGDITAAHTFSAMEPSCAGTGCHVNTLPEAHAKFVGPGKRYPMYEDSCDLCHANEDPERIDMATATADCATCHAETHGDIAEKHLSPTDAACFGSGCHDVSKDLPTVHAAYVAEGAEHSTYQSTCDLCHANQDPERIDWDIATAECAGVCHPVTNHTEMLVSHAPTSASDACVDCHTSNLATIHRADTDPTRCAVCHGSASNWTKSADCASCHEPHAVDSAFCTGCHTVANGTYAGAATFSASKHAATGASTLARTTYPGESYGAGECANCHGVHTTTRTAGNQLCYDCHDAAGTTKPDAYSYQGGTAYGTSAHGESAGAQGCGVCHAVHGAKEGATQVAAGLQKSEPGVCTGSVSQPGCHALATNSDNGVNILGRFSAGSDAKAHHDVYGSGQHIDCSSCHNPHTDDQETPYTNPRAIGEDLPDAAERFRDENGRVYALVGAQHDAIGPVITGSSFYGSANTPQTRSTYWYTDEPSYGFIDYGTTDAFGSTYNANATWLSTYHWLSGMNFPIGTTWYWRYRQIDALGNVSYGPTNTYRVPWTYTTTSPTVTGGQAGTPVTVTWTTQGACSSYVDFGPTTAYGSTTGSATNVTNHSVTLTGLAPGTYQLRARSTRDGDTYTSANMMVTVYATYGTPPVLTPVPSDYNIAGPKEITFNWSQPNVTQAPFTYQLHVWDPYSSPAYEYTSAWLSSNSATLTLDGDHNYFWSVQAKDKDGELYPLQNPLGTFALFYYNGGSGSCPFLYTWNGVEYVFESDEFAAGKLGLNTKSGFRKPNPFDYHILNTDPAPKDGAIEYKLVEERHETDYLDQVKLYTVEGPADKDIYVERTQAEGAGRFTSFDAVIHTTEKNLKAPKVTWVNTGQDVTEKVSAADGDYLMLNEDRNNGYDYQTIELDLGDVKDAPKTKLVIDGRTCIPTSVAGRQRSLQFGPQVKFEVQNASGAWVAVPTTNTILPKPPEFRRPFVLDLSKVWISDSRKVRFTYLYKTYFDAILLDTSADVPVKLTELPLLSADLQPHGFNAKSSLGELYDYVYGEPVQDPTYYLPGWYTKFGRVDPLLKDIDDKFVIWGGGDELTFRFKQPEAPGVGVTRKFMFVSDGYYKDLKQTIDHTVEPLPFAAMSNFPYSASEHYPDDAEHEAYRQEWNTRYQGEGSTIDLTPESGELSSLIEDAGQVVESAIGAVAAAFTPDEPVAVQHADTDVASLGEYEDTRYSVDTDRIAVKVTYPSSSTSLNASAGWHSASAVTALPTPAAPGTPIDGATLTSTTTDNNAYWRTNLATEDRSYNWQLFRFDVAANLLPNSTGLQLTWNGHGEPTTGYPVKLYLWDFQASEWVLATQGEGGNDFDLWHTERQPGTESFCISCHQTTPPAGSAGAASYANMASAWTVDAHGDRAGGGFGGTLKAPYARGQSPVPCGVCHDSHGSSNAYHLKETINGQGVSVSASNTWDNACVACHAGTVSQWHNECRVCHQENTDHTWGPDIDGSWDCARCHGHGKSWPHTPVGCHGCGDPDGMVWRTF